jgi:flagellar basal body rod protein FlgB
MSATNLGDITPAPSPLDSLREIESDPSEETLSGNTVNLEQQMINLGDVTRDFSMTANIRRAFHQLILSALK